MKKTGGYFVVSLDFELFWGMFDKQTIDSYGERILGERTAIPRTLDLFHSYGIHATWATVGMLMVRDKKELCAHLPPPHLRPHYTDARMSSYHYIDTTRIGNNETDDPYHYGASMVQAITRVPFQEIGNHTFSHFYCMDGEHNEPSVFEADLDAHARIAKTYSLYPTAVVFPRNQACTQALRVCYKKGIRVYRGNETHLWYHARKDAAQSLLIRAFRLIDHYINLSGHHTYLLTPPTEGVLYNVPASRFLRPWSNKLRFLEWLKIRRITRAMTHAAKNGEVFHLWWHPHNMGIDQIENFTTLKKIIDHYIALKHAYGMESLTMTEAYDQAGK
ncbi:MAG TPA: polysaccharide deacetylase [Candidatus Paceibacterota bacterium]|nr:polysaccharide deacetylase [Candidatus Paceibacterota bacterium]